MNKNFNGPLFIIGYPRSGTKLLRDLLNQNSQIGIPEVETNFIPKIVSKYGNIPNLYDENKFDNFYNDVKNTVFWRLVNIDKTELTKEDIKNNSDISSWNSIFEVILRYYAPKEKNTNFIWGDKTPTYLDKITTLKNIFPTAKFIHIIRDPRDCCLSEKKTWGKNIFRTAELWRRKNMKARKDGKKISSDYIEVFYEDLLSNTEIVMKRICNFINCKYTDKMTRIIKPSENLGDTKGKIVIVTNNIKKYIKELEENEIKRIEEITYPLIILYDYEFQFNVSYKPVNKYLLFIYKLSDGLSMVIFNIKDKGYINGVKHYYQLLKDI